MFVTGCVPVEQTNFPPDARSVAEMLRARIADCHAVIHIAGSVFGAEPREPEPDAPRRSYTQIELEIARELGKPVYVFVCTEGFAYDEHEPEASVPRGLYTAMPRRWAKRSPISRTTEIAMVPRVTHSKCGFGSQSWRWWPSFRLLVNAGVASHRQRIQAWTRISSPDPGYSAVPHRGLPDTRRS